MRTTLVHGRSQHGRSSKAIVDEWLRSLESGFDAHKLTVPKLECIAPYYGDALDGLVRARMTRGHINPDEQTRGGGFDEFVREVAADLGEGAVPQDIRTLAPASSAAADRDREERAAYNHPLVLALARAIDGQLPGASMAALGLVLQDVWVYLTDPDVRNEIKKLVSRDLRGAELIIAHSLGSVVIYDVLADNSLPPPRLLLTAGSPLAIRAIGRRLSNPPRTWMSRPVSWTNVYDPRDIVALRPLDGVTFYPFASSIRNCPIENLSDDHHSIAGYLSTWPIVSAINNLQAAG